MILHQALIPVCLVEGHWDLRQSTLGNDADLFNDKDLKLRNELRPFPPPP